VCQWSESSTSARQCRHRPSDTLHSSVATCCQHDVTFVSYRGWPWGVKPYICWLCRFVSECHVTGTTDSSSTSSGLSRHSDLLLLQQLLLLLLLLLADIHCVLNKKCQFWWSISGMWIKVIQLLLQCIRLLPVIMPMFNLLCPFILSRLSTSNSTTSTFWSMHCLPQLSTVPFST